jgi:polysaccharide export outer membrane protein
MLEPLSHRSLLSAFAAAVACLALLLTGCPPPAVVGTAIPTVEIPPAVLGADDVISVQVYLEEKLSGQHRIDTDGCIVLPLVGSLSVAGMTPPEVAQLVADKLRDGYLHDPKVSVSVVEFNSRKISVIGEVKSPGRYPYRDGMTLIQAIAEAGGTTPTAMLSSVLVTRAAQDSMQPRQFDVPYRRITMGRSPDFQLLPGDVVVVQESPVR